MPKPLRRIAKKVKVDTEQKGPALLGDLRAGREGAAQRPRVNFSTSQMAKNY